MDFEEFGQNTVLNLPKVNNAHNNKRVFQKKLELKSTATRQKLVKYF